jgi:hypothetical protein
MLTIRPGGVGMRVEPVVVFAPRVSEEEFEQSLALIVTLIHACAIQSAAERAREISENARAHPERYRTKRRE